MRFSTDSCNRIWTNGRQIVSGSDRCVKIQLVDLTINLTVMIKNDSNIKEKNRGKFTKRLWQILRCNNGIRASRHNCRPQVFGNALRKSGTGTRKERVRERFPSIHREFLCIPVWLSSRGLLSSFPRLVGQSTLTHQDWDSAQPNTRQFMNVKYMNSYMWTDHRSYVRN